MTPRWEVHKQRSGEGRAKLVRILLSESISICRSGRRVPLGRREFIEGIQIRYYSHCQGSRIPPAALAIVVYGENVLRSHVSEVKDQVAILALIMYGHDASIGVCQVKFSTRPDA